MRGVGGGVAALVALAAGTALAQPVATLRDPGQHSVRMVRTTTPPVIDGKLDEPAWKTAALVDDLHQVSPIEYADPDERSEIYLLYDDEALYIGAYLYDNMPQDITANNLRQNDSIGQDDRFYVTIDPFNSRRSGYYFGVNPNGVRSDGLYINVSEFYGAWDSIFFAEAGRFEGGWIAELAIPFKSLSFDPSTDTWGLNFSRGVVRKNENLAWVSRNRQYNPSVSGLAQGFTGLDPHGLDVVPSATLLRSHVAATGETSTDLKPSLDLVYKLTPSLNGLLTINTDFSATEVDDRQVNLTRFNLFFPEKRDFFLREADLFEFGRIGAQADLISVGRPSRENGRPFFSRRIGLGSAGEIVDLDYGAKVSGRVGRWDLGALSIRQAENNGVVADTLSVVRAKVGLFGDSTLGFVATEGDPRSDLTNAVTGVDFQYRNTRLPGGRTIEGEVWYEQSNTEGVTSDQSAVGFGLRVPSTNGFRGSLGVKELDANFYPALGFVDRRNVRVSTFDVGYTHRLPRGSYLQSVFTSLDGEYVESLDGVRQSSTFSLRPFLLTNRTGDTLLMVYREQRDFVPVGGFNIFRDVIVPGGDYAFNDLGMRFQGGQHRKFSGFVMYVTGDFYGGTRVNINGELVWRPSARFRTLVGYDYNEVELPTGNFESRLVRLGFDVAFSSKISLVNLVQYDNGSETMGINLRLHWIPVPGRELFFVVNQGLEDFDRDNSFRTQQTDVTAKFGYTFRF
jgi:Domain of unknown function (DUF5916)/Carbohydrate family 9 binding domain-like